MSTAALPPILEPTDPGYTREVYDVKQAAAYLVVHVSRIYADIAKGELAHRKDGNRRLRFSQADLDAWRLARRVEVRGAVSRETRPPVPRPRLLPSADLPLPKVRRFS